MNTKVRYPRRKLVALIAVAVTVATLTGCSTISYEEAQASDHRLVQTDVNLLGLRSWSYIGPDGQEVPLTDSCSKHILDICHASPDGSVQFRYSSVKSDPVAYESLLLNGEERDIECVTEGFFGGYICAPTD